MRSTSLTIAFLFCAGAAQATDSPAQREWKRVINNHGMNCPVITNFEKLNETSDGSIFRISCKTNDGANDWKLRYILRANGTDAVEKW